jgi:hypothetical protein
MFSAWCFVEVIGNYCDTAFNRSQGWAAIKAASFSKWKTIQELRGGDELYRPS